MQTVMTAASSSSGSRGLFAGATKRLLVIRHGQATHNPRAEAAKDEGCSHQEFLELMRQDDSMDAELTELGEFQAKQLSKKFRNGAAGRADVQKIQLIVSSPLSRTLKTADLALPSTLFTNNNTNTTTTAVPTRMCVEDFREINGWLKNAKRRNKVDIQERFPGWNLDELVHENDVLWQPELESTDDCAQRGYQGFCWLMERPEEHIALVTHGGILRFAMNDHPNIRVVDGRQPRHQENAALLQSNGKQTDKKERDVHARFDNCEMRHYIMSCSHDDESESELNGNNKNDERQKSIITLTEVDCDLV